MEPFTSSPEIEVQERAAELLTLLSFVEADLRTHVPPSGKSNGGDDIPGMESGFDTTKDDTPPYPKSLFLFQPLFTAHELNAVALGAQEAVRIPEGLDLDRDIVPGGGFLDIDEEEVKGDSEEEENGLDLGEGGGARMEELRRVLREQEDAGKKRGHKKGKGKGRKVEAEIMSVEHRAEKDKVSPVCLCGKELGRGLC